MPGLLWSCIYPYNSPLGWVWVSASHILDVPCVLPYVQPHVDPFWFCWFSSFEARGKGKESESSEAEVPPAPVTETPALDVPLIVSGCQNQTISEIVKGTYFRHGNNHGKPVYKKKREAVPDDDDDLDVLIYYWDERDGDENCGWWFSPSVGGEMVWAYHPSRKAWIQFHGLMFF